MYWNDFNTFSCFLLYILYYLVYNTNEILQKFNIITITLKSYYNYVKCIDILAENYKIDVYHNRGTMRVISGSARGTKLNSINSISTRPTLDRVKESLFNILQNKIQDSIILDLFAGSGAIAIEFLSRGAQKAYLCEKNHLATQMIYSNLEKTKLTSKAVIIGKDYQKTLQILQQEKVKFDIVYIDPPYQANIAVKALQMILSLNLLKEKGILIIETDDEKRELLELEKLEVQVVDIRKYGRVSLIFLT